MQARERFLITLGVMFFSLLLKWFIPNFVAADRTKKLCHRFLRAWPKIPSFGRILRLLGWDIINAAPGLVVLACVLEGSNLRNICNGSAGNYGFIFAIACFMIYIVLYGIAVICRYIFLETAERVCRWRFLCGLALWVIGLIMLFNSSWLVVGD